MFCGGFPAVRAPRQVFPLGPGPITITSTHATATVAASISFDANPATFANFNQTSTGVALPLLRNFFDISGRGQFCFTVNVGALNLPNITNGTLATIQVVFNGGDGALYQCTDVVLSSTYTGANITCPNNLVALSSTANATSTRIASASGTATSAAASATASARSAALGRQELSVVGAGLAGVSAMALVLL